MIRVMVPFLVSIVVVLLVVGLATRTQRAQFVWSEIARHRREAEHVAGEAVDELAETTA
jgi:hypothetical protein